MKINKKKLILIIASIFCILLVTLFVFRGVVRGYIIPKFVDIVYGPSVDKNFARDYPDVNKKLEEFGFTFKNSPRRDCNVNGEAMYEGIRETIYCFYSTRNDDITFSSQLVSNWKQNSVSLEKYLLASGWTKQWNELQPIDEIYNNPNNDVSVAVNYTKTHGPTECELSIVYNAGYPHPDTTYAIESCEREIKIFGGY